jgi:hypothetical protein
LLSLFDCVVFKYFYFNSLLEKGNMHSSKKRSRIQTDEPFDVSFPVSLHLLSISSIKEYCALTPSSRFAKMATWTQEPLILQNHPPPSSPPPNLSLQTHPSQPFTPLPPLQKFGASLNEH